MSRGPIQVAFRRDVLASALREVASAVHKGPITLWNCVHIQTGSVTTLTTFNEVFQVSCDIEPVSCDGAISFAVSAERLNAIVQSFSGDHEVILSIDGRDVTVKCQRAKLKLSGEPVEGYAMRQSPEGETANLPAKALYSALRTTLHAADESGPPTPWKTGLHLSCASDRTTVTAAAKSGMARCSVDMDSGVEMSVIIPTPTLAFIAKLDRGTDARIEKGERSALIQIDGNLRIVTSIVDSEYPDVSGVIPTTENAAAIIDPKALLTALSRVQLVSDQKERMLRFDFAPDRLTISGQAGYGSGSEEVPCDYTGKPIVLGLRADQLRNVVTALNPDTLRIAIVDNELPLTLTAVGRDDTLMLVMPMRL